MFGHRILAWSFSIYVSENPKQREREREREMVCLLERKQVSRENDAKEIGMMVNEFCIFINKDDDISKNLPGTFFCRVYSFKL